MTTKRKFCGLELKEGEFDDFIGICEFCFQEVMQEEQEENECN